MTTFLVAMIALGGQASSDAGRLRTFLAAAHQRTDDAGLPRVVPQAVDGELRWLRSYASGRDRVDINARTGLVQEFRRSYPADRPRPIKDDRGRHYEWGIVPRHVSDDEVRELARRDYAASGRPYTVEFDAVEDQVGDDSLVVHGNPTYRGVPYWNGPEASYRSLIWIDRESGDLNLFSAPGAEPPAPPASLTPRGSAPEATRIALRAGIAVTGGVLEPFVRFPAKLSIAVVDPRPRRDVATFLAPAEAEAARQSRSRLVYVVRLFDSRFGIPANGAPWVMDFVTVDALDGRVLQIVHDDARGQMGGGTQGTNATPFALPTEARPWRIVKDRSAWSSPARATLTRVRSKVAVAGAKVALTDGRLAFTALYDPRTGLLGVEVMDKSVQAYRPGPALAALLEKRAKERDGAARGGAGLKG